MFRGSLFLLSELKKHQLHMRQDKNRAPINEREGSLGIKEFFTWQMVKGNLFEVLIWLLIIWTGLQKEKICLF